MIDARIDARQAAQNAAFWLLCLLLAAAFLLGGGARGDIQSLMVLRPLAVMALGFGLGGLCLAHIRDYRFLCLMALGLAVLPALQLIPLPPSWWSRLPGRSLVVEIGQVAGLVELWRPMSLVPEATLNALYATSVPLAVLVLGIQLDAARRARLLAVVLAMGGISAALSLLQILGDPSGPLFFYRITNPGTPVGLFANHNHQAFLLAFMLPMIAVAVAGKAGPIRLVGLAAALLLLPIILITGSRAGLVVALAAIAAIPLILPRERRQDTLPRGAAQARTRMPQARRRIVWATVGSVALVLVGLSVWFGRGLALERLFGDEIQLDSRVRIAPIVIASILAYLPWGTGMGSFERVYQIHEPDGLLGPEYMNHAHNDWLELALTGGLPAILLAAAATCGFVLRARHLFAGKFAGSPALTQARLGLAIVLLAALASLTDYPLRVPSLAALFVVASLWAGCPLPANGSMIETVSNNGHD